MKAPLLHRARTIAHRASPVHVVRQASTTKIMRRLADDLGLIYFGYVDQQDDEHRLVRGITASNTYSDHHYTVGTYKTYDISFVVRRDTLVYGDRRFKDHFWTILTVDLHATQDIPRAFIAHPSGQDLMLAKFASLAPLPLNAGDPLLHKFLASRTLYGRLARERRLNILFPPHILQAYAEHAGAMSVEITDGTLYVYQTEIHPSRALLTAMLNFGIWLAQTVDAQAPLLDRSDDD